MRSDGMCGVGRCLGGEGKRRIKEEREREKKEVELELVVVKGVWYGTVSRRALYYAPGSIGPSTLSCLPHSRLLLCVLEHFLLLFCASACLCAKWV